MTWILLPLAVTLTGSIDDKFAETLKETKVITKELPKFYEIRFTVDKKRKQTAYIRKEVFEYRSIQVREAFSICYDNKLAPSPELILAAFQKRFSVGGLVLEKPSDEQANWRIRFKLDLPIDISAKDLRLKLDVIATTTDGLEAEFNAGKDGDDK
ncbi:MAG: hypothetical protein K8R88_00195 [Armatimonadetes bacterium]|nr:hypothetical protein [Armatimonadota bacterium]